MAGFITNTVQIQRFASAMFGIQVGSVTLGQVNSDITAQGGLTNALNGYYAASFGSATTASVAAAVSANLGLTGAAATAATDYITAVLNSTPAAARGAAISGVLNLFSNLTADATFGAAATAWNTKVDAATAYTGTGNVSAGTLLPSNVNFTTNFESLVGTNGADTFNGLAGTGATISAVDTVDGGAGNDTLRIVTDGAVTLPGTITSIESVVINDTEHQTTTIASGQLAAVTSLTLQNGTSVGGAAMTVTLKAGDTLAIDAVTDGDAADDQATDGEINLAAAATVTSMAVTVSDVGATTSNVTDLDLDITGTGVTTLNLTAQGTANSISIANTGAALSAINIAGASPVTIWATPTTATTINASTATGVVTVDGSGTSVRAITTGTGNDVIVMGADYVGGSASTASRDIIDGGAGTDTLSVTKAVAQAIAATQANLTSIETLAISDGVTGSLNATYFTGVTKVVLAAARTAAAATITVASGTTVQMKADAGDQDTVFTVTGTGTTDTMTLALDTGVEFAGNAGTAETFTGIETLNIQTQSTSVGTVNIFADATTMTATASTETMNISGKTAITFTGAVTADVINGAGLVGAGAILTLTAGTASAAVITGGEAADVLTGSSSADIISGGAGADTITTSGGTDTVTLGAGADIFVAADAAHVGNVITDFTAGTGGDVFRIDDLGFGDLTGADTLAFKAISAGLTAAATTDNVLVVQTAIAGTSAAAVEDAYVLAGGGLSNFSSTDIMIVIYNSTTGKGEVWSDLDGDTDGAGVGVTLVATLDNITTLVGVQALVAGNFNVVA